MKLSLLHFVPVLLFQGALCARAAAPTTFQSPQLDVLPVDACVYQGEIFLEDKSSCKEQANRYAADMFCAANGFTRAVSWTVKHLDPAHPVEAKSFGFVLFVRWEFDEMQTVMRNQKTAHVFDRVKCEGSF